jgi:hypothetical protein
MPELDTREQVMDYLARMSPRETWRLNPFPGGWVATPVLPQDQMTPSAAVGLTRLVIDSETGVVYQYPSWSTTMVAEAHTTFKQTGENRAGRQIYPYQWKITIQRVRETAERIVYQLTAESLTEPSEGTQQHLLTIEKLDQVWEPRDQLSTVATVHARWVSRRNNGEWPETDTTHA